MATSVPPLETPPLFELQADLTGDAVTPGSSVFGTASQFDNTGSTVVIGDSNESTQGAAYIFTRSGTVWTRQARLDPPAPLPGVPQIFGAMCSISGDGNTVVIGARNYDIPVSQTGQAYVFTRTGTTWSAAVTIVNPNPVLGSQFGISVSMSNDGARMAIGAGDGHTYVFVLSSGLWILESTFTDPLGLYGQYVVIDGTGTRVFSSGDYSTASGNENIIGTMFVRTGSSWAVEQVLINPNTIPGDSNTYTAVRFSAINYIGDKLLVNRENRGTSNGSGGCFVYTRSGTTWTFTQKLFGYNPLPPDYQLPPTRTPGVALDTDGMFTMSMDTTGNLMTYCAYGDNTPSFNGAVYIFENGLSSPVLNQTLYDPAYSGPFPPGGRLSGAYGYYQSVSGDGRYLIASDIRNSGSSRPSNAFIYFRNIVPPAPPGPPDPIPEIIPTLDCVYDMGMRSFPPRDQSFNVLVTNNVNDYRLVPTRVFGQVIRDYAVTNYYPQVEQQRPAADRYYDKYNVYCETRPWRNDKR